MIKIEYKETSSFSSKLTVARIKYMGLAIRSYSLWDTVCLYICFTVKENRGKFLAYYKLVDK